MKYGLYIIPLMYVIAGILWIVLSDSVMFAVFPTIDRDTLAMIHLGKGSFSIVVTACTFYYLIVREHRKVLRTAETYRNIYEGNPNPMWFYDPVTLEFLSVNDAAIETYGYSRQEFLTKSILDIRQPEDILQAKELTIGSPKEDHDSGLWRHLKKDGTLLFAQVTSNKILQEGRDMILVMAVDHTELIAQKLELAKNNTFLETTLHSITDSYAMLDSNWIYTQVNANFYVVTGVTEDVLGKSLWSVFPNRTNAFQKLCVKAMEERVSGKIEDFSNFFNKWLRFSVFPREDGIAIYFSDITNEKEKDLQLQRALERYDLASKATGDVIYDLDIATGILIFNQQINVLLQLPLEDMQLSESWWQSRIHPDDVSNRTTAQNYIIGSGEKAWKGEYRIRHEDSSYKYVSDQGYMMYDADGNPVRMIGSIKDIDLLRKSTEQLKMTGEILNKVHNPVIISDADGIVTWINPAFSAVTGYSENEVLGRYHINLLYNRQTNPIIIRQLKQAIANKEPFSSEMLNYDKHNCEYWVSLNLYPIFDSYGKFESYISVQNEITEQKKRDAMITMQNEKLKAVSWLNSHEIRKPVASILALSQLMELSADAEEKDEMAAMIYKCATELDGIIMEINAEASGK